MTTRPAPGPLRRYWGRAGRPLGFRRATPRTGTYPQFVPHDRRFPGQWRGRGWIDCLDPLQRAAWGLLREGTFRSTNWAALAASNSL